MLETFSILAFVGLAALLPLYLLSDKPTTIEINSDKDFEKYDFVGSGSEDEPYLIEGLTISDQLFRGISIANTKRHFIIKNCYLFRNLLDGIKIDSIADGTGKIFNNTIQEHSQSGILIINSDNITISQNTIIESKYMIWLDNSSNCTIESNNIYAYRAPLDKESVKYRGLFVENSVNLTITNNYIKNTAFGLYLNNVDDTIIFNNFIHIVTFSAVFILDSINVTISLTTCLESFQDFFNIRYSSFISIKNSTAQDGFLGLRLFSSSNCTINYSLFTLNKIGIQIYEECLYNNISYNEISNNEERGLIIERSNYNIIHHNAFISNNDSIEFQVEDNGSYNIWFDSVLLEGNYYQGWNISTPYQIMGSANNSDPYPLETLDIFSLPNNILHSEKIFNVEFFLKFSDG